MDNSPHIHMPLVHGRKGTFELRLILSAPNYSSDRDGFYYTNKFLDNLDHRTSDIKFKIKNKSMYNTKQAQIYATF